MWAGVAALVVVRHRSNLARLVAGTEPALPERATGDALPDGNG